MYKMSSREGYAIIVQCHVFFIDNNTDSGLGIGIATEQDLFASEILLPAEVEI